MALHVTPFYQMTPIGAHTQDTTISGATAFTVPVGANAVLLAARDQNVSFTLDGTTPTAAKGLQLKADNGTVLVPVTPGQVLTFIEETATGTIDLQYVHMGN